MSVLSPVVWKIVLCFVVVLIILFAIGYFTGSEIIGEIFILVLELLCAVLEGL